MARYAVFHQGIPIRLHGSKDYECSPNVRKVGTVEAHTSHQAIVQARLQNLSPYPMVALEETVY